MSRHFRHALPLLTVAILSFAVAGPVAARPGTAHAVGARLRVRAAPRLPRGARLMAGPALSRRMRLTVALVPREASALAALATAVSTPGSPEFRRYLSVSAFARRFGATSAHIAAVSSALRSAGLSVGAPTANHLTIPVSGTTAQVERAFSVRESDVRLRGGRVAFANDRAPMLAAGIAHDVQAVIGLDSLATLHPAGLASRARAPLARPAARGHIVTGGPQPCSTISSGSFGYTADTIASAYDFAPLYQSGDLGQGQNVAVVEFEPYDPNDVASYQTCYATSASVTPVNVGGGPGADVPGSTDDGEAALDIEQVIGVAPRASVLVYQAPNSFAAAELLMSQLASDDRAKVISDSWGICDEIAQSPSHQAQTAAQHTALQEMVAQGQSFLAASGDTGSETCFQGNPSNTDLSVDSPASDPFATGVGGTTLYEMNGSTPQYYSPPDGLPPVDSIWSDNSGATGGGISTLYPMPAFQSGASASLGVVNAANTGSACGAASPCREVPDVSADGSPTTGYAFFVTSGGAQTWQQIAGTSAAAPLWAGLFALANASTACHGLTLGDANPSLYSVAGTAYASNFRDASAPSPLDFNGSDNDYTGDHPGDWPIASGYDMATGLGTPLGSALAGSLCALRAPVPPPSGPPVLTPPVSHVYAVNVTGPGDQRTSTGQSVTLAVHATDSGNAALSYTATGLPAGLGINGATGVISGTPTAAQKATVTVRASDGFGNAGSAVFTWSVLGRPSAARATLTGLGTGAPKLSVSVAAGTLAPALRSVTIRLPGGLQFAKKAKSLARGIRVKSGSKAVAVALALHRGALTITFKVPVAKASVTIGGRAVTITKAERAMIRRHKVKKLTVSMTTTDASGNTTRLSVTFKTPA